MSRVDSQWWELEAVHVLGATDKALLLDYEGSQHWVPVSQIDDDPLPEVGDTTDLVIATWIAKNLGWCDE